MNYPNYMQIFDQNVHPPIHFKGGYHVSNPTEPMNLPPVNEGCTNSWIEINKLLTFLTLRTRTTLWGELRICSTNSRKFQRSLCPHSTLSPEFLKLTEKFERRIKYFFIGHHVEPNTTYEVSMKIILKGFEGDVTSKIVGPPTPLAPPQPPKNIETFRESPTSIGLTWKAPGNGVKISYYVV